MYCLQGPHRRDASHTDTKFRTRYCRCTGWNRRRPSTVARIAAQFHARHWASYGVHHASVSQFGVAPTGDTGYCVGDSYQSIGIVGLFGVQVHNKRGRQ